MLIPGTSFNKNRDKLFFFTGYEYFYQVLDTGLLRATVPTAGDADRRFLALRNCETRATSRRPADRPGQVNQRNLFPGGIIPAIA